MSWVSDQVVEEREAEKGMRSNQSNAKRNRQLQGRMQRCGRVDTPAVGCVGPRVQRETEGGVDFVLVVSGDLCRVELECFHLPAAGEAIGRLLLRKITKRRPS